jgi:hypothetical protein
MLFVLRLEPSKKDFELLGECYIYGVIDGQLFSNRMPEYEDILLV